MLDLTAWRERYSDSDWKARLVAEQDAAAIAALQRNTQTGRPLASDDLLCKLEHQLGRRRRPLSVCPVQ